MSKYISFAIAFVLFQFAIWVFTHNPTLWWCLEAGLATLVGIGFFAFAMSKLSEDLDL